MVIYWLFRLTILITKPLPIWFAYKLGAGVAQICYFFFNAQRRALNANLARVLASDDKRAVDAVARRAYRNFGKFVVDFIHFPAVTRQEVRQRLRFAQWTELDDTVAEGRGVLIVTMHCGVWDMGAAAFAAYDYPIHAIVDSFRNPRLDELVHGSRAKLGLDVVPRERVGPSTLRALKRGDILATLIDAPSPGMTVDVEFMGATTTVSAVPARIALATGARAVPALVLRGPENDSIVRPLLDLRGACYEPTGDEERDVQALTELIMKSLERMVRQHPDQWMLFSHFWPQQASAAPER